jgi:hypothetical protein
MESPPDPTSWNSRNPRPNQARRSKDFRISAAFNYRNLILRARQEAVVTARNERAVRVVPGAAADPRGNRGANGRRRCTAERLVSTSTQLMLVRVDRSRPTYGGVGLRRRKRDGAGVT